MNPQSVQSSAGRFVPRLPRRAAGWAALILVLALVATSVVLGSGAAGAKVSLADLGNWLSSSRANTVVHVNGTTGQVDGRVELPGSGGGPIEVGTDGSVVLVLDQATGTVSRIDPAQLAVPQTRSYGTGGLALAVGGGRAWLIDPLAGTVQPIDPVSLAPLSGAVDLGSRPLGPSGADASGNLWVTLPATGQLVRIQGTVPTAPLPVAEPGHTLRLTISDNRPVVTDATAGVVKVMGPQGPLRTINLPDAVAKAAPESVRIPERTEGPLLPILATSSGQLVLLNIDDGAVQAAPLTTSGQSEYGAPEVLGTRVYVPDRTAGQLIVYDTAAAAFAPAVRVTGSPGPLEIDVRDGLLWANDQTQATAVVVDARGTVHPVDKYKPGAPSEADKTPSPTASPTASRTNTPTTGPTSGATSGPTSGPGADPTSGPPAPQPSTTAPENPAPPTPPAPAVTITKWVTETPVPPAPPAPPPVQPPPVQPPPVRPPAPPAPPAPTTRPAVPPTTRVPAPPTRTSAPPRTSPPPPAPGTTRPPVTTPPVSTPPPTTPTTTAPSTPPAPRPQPPGTPKAESGPGRITLVFAASPGARPDRYAVAGLPAGAKAAPATVGPGGPFQFVITGLSCAREYGFKVVAEFGATKLESAASTPVRPCVLVSAPTSVKAEVPRNGHGFTVTWKAPANAGGSKVTYRVAWSAASGGASGGTNATATTATATGLANGTSYNITVTAANEVGTGPAATAVANLTPPSHVYNVGPNANDGVTVGIRSGPGVAGTRSVAQIPSGYTGPITVHCQTTGESVPRDGTNLRSSIWDKVTWNGYSGWTTDLYIRTPNSDQATFSPELWQCE